jgi:hypothetical protein
VSRADAVGAESVSDEPGEKLMLLLNFRNETPGHALTAAGAGSSLGPGDGRGHDVLASAVRQANLEVLALARLATTTEANLIDASCFVLARD